MSDLIRREDVLPFLDEHCSMELYPSEWDEVREAIRIIPAANADPEWISVEDRLPETKDPVLCYYLGKDGKHHYSVGYHERYGSYAEAWYVEIEYNCAGYGCERVTHWMPLPEPPKMDAEDAQHGP